MSQDILNDFSSQIQQRLLQLHQDIEQLQVKIKQPDQQSMKPEQSLEMEALNHKISQMPIAIVGMASLFPQSTDLQEYWNNIVQKVDCITDVPSSRWNVDDYYDPDPTVPDKTYCKRGGFIPDIDFNPMEFGLPPNILEVTDITQILSLVVARQALRDAGYEQASESVRDRTGVILGVGGGQKLITPLTARLQSPVLEKVLTSSGLSHQETEKIIEKVKLAYIGWEENSFPGMLGNVIAGRIANRLDLGGINCVVDAACASSLSALQMSLDQLTTRRSDMMITGGVDADNSPFMYLCFSKTPAFSKQDQMRPFDASSDGMIVGEGIGMMVLKRLIDAERDGDRIYAVVKGIGASSDGKYKSIYAPRPSGQAKALRRAYENADCDPNSVRLVEAHGTGTAAGDPAEFTALKDVFSDAQTDLQTIALGSVKSQIGHTKSAAGAASLIKAALALHHKILPPTLNVSQPNPKLNIEQSPFYLNTEPRPWIRTDIVPPRRAGVSSFGFGGTNYHVVLEEYTGKQSQAYRLHKVPATLLFAAADPTQLLAQCENILARWQSDVAEQHYYDWVVASRSMDIPTASARLGLVAASLSEASKLLQTAIQSLKNKLDADAWQHPQGIFYRKTGMEIAGKVVALFPGQGSQYLNMGRELALNFPTVHESFAAMDTLFLRDQLSPISNIVYPRPVFETAQQQQQVDTLQKTDNAQPAIGALSMGLYKTLHQAGFQADFVAGHSFGEISALWAAGVLSDEDYCFLVKARGQALATPAHPNFDAGKMLAITGDIATIQDVVKNFPNVLIANWNSSNQVVLSGTTPEINNVQHRLTEFGFATTLLPVAAAFHTPLVSHAYQQFAQALRIVRFNSPKVPVYSNITAEPYPDTPTEIGQTVASQILNPVCFKQEIENIYAAGGRIFVEVGPRSVLTHLTQNILGEKPHLAVSLNPSRKGDSDRQLRTAVMQLQVAGLPLKNFDPYGVEQVPAAPASKNGMTIRLNGSNYVSKKTKTAFDQALTDGYRISRQPQSLESQPVEHQQPIQAVSLPAAQPKTVVSQRQLDVTKFITPMLQIVSEKTGYPPEMLDLSMDMEADLGIDSIKRVEILGAMQEQFPELPPMQPEILSELRTLQQIVQYLSQQNPDVEASIPETVVHTSISTDEAVLTIETRSEPNDLLSTLEKKPDFVLNYSLIQSLLSVVSEKTGYPVEMLTLEMDMEADLGIDSIKRVEILGAMQDQFVALPPVQPEALAELRTLGQIVQHMGQQSEAVATTTQPETGSVKPISVQSPSDPANTAAVSTIAVAIPTSQATSPSVLNLGSNELVAALLAIVSEKTGYPSEMLELTMDMEADLGIDSIKRVEILGAMQEQFPDLPAASPEALAEMRTLAQIVDYMGQVEGTAAGAVASPNPAESASVISSSAKTAVPATMPDLVTVPTIPVSEDPAEVSSEPSVETETATNLAHLVSALLNIVSDKTGYPPEMLDLSMDMEADLGIDSIKRVEILGAVQDGLPNLPPVNPEALAEMRTLEQIVQYMGQQMSPTEKKNAIAAPESTAPMLAGDTSIQRGQATISPLPTPDWLDFSLPTQTVCLVTDDGSSLTTHLAQDLAARGWQVVVLSLPETLVARQQPFSLPIPRIVLDDLSEAHLKQQFEIIAQHHGSIAAFIYLQPQLETSFASGTIEQSQATLNLPGATSLLKHAFLLAKHLKPSLTEAAKQCRSCFLTVTHLDGTFGLRTASLKTAQMVSGGLFGLTKTLNLEWPQVFCRAIDIFPECSVSIAIQNIVQELHDPNRLISEVGYGPAGRVTLTCGELIESASTNLAKIDQKTVFLVSGGGKGITAQCITQLAKFTQCRFILLGRSELMAEPTWAQGIEAAGELKKQAIAAFMTNNPKTTPATIQKAVKAVLSQREITATLQAIQKAGGKAEYLSADLTQTQDLRLRLAKIAERFGPITGIIHGAGNLADKLIENKSERDFDLVYTTKIKGLDTLLNSVDCEHLNHLVLFSSAAGFYGNIGQSDYAIANEVLNKFAHQFKHRHPDCHVVSFNWGPWDSGMVTPAVKRIFAERKIEVIPTEIGTQIFALQLLQGNSETVQVLVGSPLAVLAADTKGEHNTYQIRRRLDLSANPFLQDHQIGNQVVLPMACSMAWIANTCEQLYPGYRFFSYEQHKVLKGIVFDDSLTSEYILSLEEINTAQTGEIQLKAMIWSELPDGKPRYHYSSNLTLKQSLPLAPRYDSFDLTPDPAVANLSPYQDGTLFHGPMFQTIQQVLNVTPKRLTLECVLPVVESEKRQQFSRPAVDAIAHDIPYQSMLIWAWRFHQAGSLPLSCQRGEQFRSMPIGETIYVSMAVVSSTPTKLIANVVTHDAQGLIYSQVFGAEVTISKQLNQLFGMADATSLSLIA